MLPVSPAAEGKIWRLLPNAVGPPGAGGGCWSCCPWAIQSCGQAAEAPAETTLERIQRTGVVRVAYANEAPYGYRDIQTGRVTGEAPEIACVVLGRLGGKVHAASGDNAGQGRVVRRLRLGALLSHCDRDVACNAGGRTMAPCAVTSRAWSP